MDTLKSGQDSKKADDTKSPRSPGQTFIKNH